MSVQSLIVAILVAACSLYAAWTLMPAAARRGIARALLKLRLPAAVASRLQRQLEPSTGCACDGCDAGSKKPGASDPQPIRIHPRAK